MANEQTGWYGCDLDGTLAKYESGHFAKYGPTHIGEPIGPMVERVKEWLVAGRNVKIMTARIAVEDATFRAEIIMEIEKWCITHLGQALPVTNIKDFEMIALYDDRAVQVETNTGRVIGFEK